MQQNKKNNSRLPYVLLSVMLVASLVLSQPSVAERGHRTLASDSLVTDTATVDTLVADTAAADTVVLNQEIWPCVTVGASMPKSFRARKTNVISRSDSLQAVFDTLCTSGRPLRVLHLGDSHVAGKTFPMTIKAELEAAWGVSFNDTTGHGIQYSYMAKNGATATSFLTDARMQLVEEKQPDLLILSFGTNECHGMGYKETLHEQELDEVIGRLRSHCPKAKMLLTTPPGDYLTTRRVTYPVNKQTGKRQRVVRRYKKPNPMSARCATLLDKYGEEKGLAVWNLNAIAGGATAVQNWIAARMMRNDRIHFTPAGYALQGRLFSEALLTAYNDYINAHNAAVATNAHPIEN